MSEPGSEGYAASKGGIYSLTHALALSLSEWNITVNSIAPGWIQTQDYDQLDRKTILSTLPDEWANRRYCPYVFISLPG